MTTRINLQYTETIVTKQTVENIVQNVLVINKVNTVYVN